MRYVMIIVAYMLIYIGADYKRSELSSLETFSKEWWVQVILITAGGTILLIAPD